MVAKKLEEIAKSAKEKLNDLGKKAGEALEEAKEEAFKIIGTIEQKLEDREGVIGEIANAADSIYAAAKSKHEDIKSRGGYKQVAIENADKAVDKTHAFAEKVGEKLDVAFNKTDNYIDRLENTLIGLNDGKLDFDKIKAVVKDKSQVVKEYGIDTYNNLVTIVNEGKDNLKQHFREYVPTKEERETIYTGIGAKRQKFLFKRDYDACLKYTSESFGKIPGQLKLKPKIIIDIRESASKNKYELLEFYGKELAEKKISDDEFTSKYNAAVKYL